MTVRLHLRIWLWRARPALAVLAVVAIAWTAWSLATTGPPSAAVVVAARDLGAGVPLAADDLRVVRLPLGTLPAGTAGDVGAWLGHRLAVDVPRGLPLVTSLRAGDRFALDPPPGSVVVPVPVSSADLLRVGDRVDLVAAGCPEEGPLATGALVVDLGSADALLVATDAAQARRVVAVGDFCPIAALLVE